MERAALTSRCAARRSPPPRVEISADEKPTNRPNRMLMAPIIGGGMVPYCLTNTPTRVRVLRRNAPAAPSTTASMSRTNSVGVMPVRNSRWDANLLQ